MNKLKMFLTVFIVIPIFAMTVYAQDDVSYINEAQQIVEKEGVDFEQVRISPLNTLWSTIKKSAAKGAEYIFADFSKILAVMMITSLVNLFAISENTNITKTVNMVSVAAIFSSVIGGFSASAEAVSKNMTDIKNFMIAFMPAFAGVSFASGEMITSTVYTGFFLISIITVANFCINYIVPSLNIFMIAGVTSSVSSVINMKQLCSFYSKAVKTAMTTAVSVLCFMLSVQTTITQGQDTLAVKTGKLIVTSAVPVIGSALQGAVGSVYTSMGVLKSFFGIAGITVTVGIFLPGIVTLAIKWIEYSVLSAIGTMLGNKPASELIMYFREVVEIMLSMLILFMVLLVFSLSIMIKLMQGV